MTGNYGFAINLKFVSNSSMNLSKNIFGILRDESHESYILRQTLFEKELLNGNVVFLGSNEFTFRHLCDEEVVEKLIDLGKIYDGKFVGVFEWEYYDDDLTKVHTFLKNGKIFSEFLQ
jgi:hypothetical protein